MVVALLHSKNGPMSLGQMAAMWKIPGAATGSSWRIG
jgi:hypothetical protein